MSAQLRRHTPVDLGDRGSFRDDASDSGYGSVSDGSSVFLGSQTVLDGSLAKDSSSAHVAPSMQEELYRENCRLLTGSIEDTKHVLKVTPG
jgi:hypothetical protein